MVEGHSNPEGDPMRPTSSAIAHVAALLALLAAAAGAQPAFLVRDLQTSSVNPGSEPRYLLVWQGRAYFVAADRLRGYELWTTDGTRQGTEVVRDASPGPPGSWNVFGGTGLLAASDDRLWVTLDDGVSGHELWTSDGTAAGTRLVRDLCPGPCGTEFYDRPFAGGDTVFFAARDEALGLELWASDGTRDGTRLVKDLCPGPCDSVPAALARLGDVVLFEATDEEHGRELWRSDGSAVGTALIEGVCSGACHDWAVLGNEAFFGIGTRLWKTDGTPEGTRPVKDLCTQPCNLRAFAFGDALLVASRSGRELWKSDGTPEGTTLLATVPQEHRIESDLYALARKGAPPAALFFVLGSGEPRWQIWRTDGTAAGTFAAVDLAAELSETGAVAGGRLVFGAASPEGNFEPWASDGTPEGTGQLREIRQGTRTSLPENLTSFGSQVLFTAFNGLGTELWITDGTPEGTRLLKDVNGPDASANPTELTAFEARFELLGFGGRILFAAGSDGDGRSLWTSVGTAEGTTIVAAGVEPLEIVSGSRLFFAATDAESYRQPWVSDGTPEGTRRLSPLPPLDGFAYELVTIGSTFFFAEGGEHAGQRLWRSDGTSEGTVMVKDLEPDWQAGCGVLLPGSCADYVDFPRDLTPLGETLFLVGSDFERGAELWKSDGTEAGTEVVADLEPGEDGSDPRELTAAGERLFFTASVGGVRALWSTDGTAADTVAVDVGDAGEPRDLAALGAAVYFLATAGDGDGLFACAGACGEAVLVKVLEADGFPGFASRLTAVADRLFFAVSTEAMGQELWTSDGIAEGTGLVTEIAAGARGAYPQSFAAIDGRLFFAADDGTAGLEPWVSDGTAAGTCRVQDVAPGRAPSSPGEFVAAGDLVYFAADDATAGRELWAVPRTDLCRLGRLRGALSKP
jgi:ELWxxDGT repeat protein